MAPCFSVGLLAFCAVSGVVLAVQTDETTSRPSSTAADNSTELDQHAPNLTSKTAGDSASVVSNGVMLDTVLTYLLTHYARAAAAAAASELDARLPANAQQPPAQLVAEFGRTLSSIEDSLTRLAARELGYPCRTATDCLQNSAGTVICKRGLCACADGFSPLGGSSWRCETPGYCETDRDCAAFKNSTVCVNSSCQCNADSWARDSDGSCQPLISAGQRCSSTDQCQARDSQASCSEGVCSCVATTLGGYQYRLANGSTCTEGRVELRRVRYGQSVHQDWAYVCDDDWNSSDARVLCRTLGFSSATAYIKSRYGGSAKFHMDNVKCRGSETSLLECPYNGWGKHNCGAAEVAAVACS